MSQGNTDQPVPAGRIEVPVDAPTTERPLQGAIQPDAAALAQAQPLDDQALTSETADEALTLDLDGPLPRSAGRLLFWGLGAVAGMSLLQLGAGLISLWATAPWWAGLWALALLMLLLGAGQSVWREGRALRHLKRNVRWQREAKELGEGGALSHEGQQFCQRLARDTRAIDTPGFARWQAAGVGHLTAAEQIDLYRQLVLHPADDQARQRILRWSGETAVWVALSPFAALDMLIVLWRNLKMIEQVAACYGVRPGYWSRIGLIRQVLRHMVYLGAAELVSDVGMDWLGAELSARLSARMAQGVGAGLLTVRLGMATMRVCRPLAFTDQEQPRLRQFRGALVRMVMHRLTAARQSTPSMTTLQQEMAELEAAKVNRSHHQTPHADN